MGSSDESPISDRIFNNLFIVLIGAMPDSVLIALHGKLHLIYATPDEAGNTILILQMKK